MCIWWSIYPKRKIVARRKYRGSRADFVITIIFFARNLLPLAILTAKNLIQYKDLLKQILAASDLFDMFSKSVKIPRPPGSAEPLGAVRHQNTQETWYPPGAPERLGSLGRPWSLGAPKPLRTVSSLQLGFHFKGSQGRKVFLKIPCFEKVRWKSGNYTRYPWDPQDRGTVMGEMAAGISGISY